jgi:hypothetical protein
MGTAKKVAAAQTASFNPDTKEITFKTPEGRV